MVKFFLKNILVITLVFGMKNIYSQDNNAFDKDSVHVWGTFSDVISFNGVDTAFYENKHPKIVKYFYNDSLIREKFFYETGKIKLINNLNEQGKKDGVFASWFENGTLKYFIFYSKGLREDSTIGWYENGKKMWEGHFKKGNGRQLQYYENGKLQKELWIEDDIKTTSLKEYCENGQVMIEEPNQRVFFSTTYYCNGKIRQTGLFSKGGIRYGPWQIYYESGQLSEKGSYSSNTDERNIKELSSTKTGEWDYFFENGKKSKIEHYDRQGKKTGKWKYYNEHGKLIKREIYVQGELKK